MGEVTYDFENLAAHQECVNHLADLQYSSDIMVTFMVGFGRKVASLRDLLAEILGKEKLGRI